MRPPLFWRLVNAIRRWRERDDRMLVEQWKATFGPERSKVVSMRSRLASVQRRADRRRQVG